VIEKQACVQKSLVWSEELWSSRVGPHKNKKIMEIKGQQSSKTSYLDTNRALEGAWARAV
jgi:hypothetical protein